MWLLVFFVLALFFVLRLGRAVVVGRPWDKVLVCGSGRDGGCRFLVAILTVL